MVFIGSMLFTLLTEGLPVMYSLRNAVVQSLNYKAPVFENKESIFSGITSDLDNSLIEKAN